MTNEGRVLGEFIDTWIPCYRDYCLHDISSLLKIITVYLVEPNLLNFSENLATNCLAFESFRHSSTATTGVNSGIFLEDLFELLYVKKTLEKSLSNESTEKLLSKDVRDVLEINLFTQWINAHCTFIYLAVMTSPTQNDNASSLLKDLENQAVLSDQDFVDLFLVLLRQATTVVNGSSIARYLFFLIEFSESTTHECAYIFEVYFQTLSSFLFHRDDVCENPLNNSIISYLGYWFLQVFQQEHYFSLQFGCRVFESWGPLFTYFVLEDSEEPSLKRKIINSLCTQSIILEYRRLIILGDRNDSIIA